MKLLHGKFNISEVLLVHNFRFDSNEGSQKSYRITGAKTPALSIKNSPAPTALQNPVMYRFMNLHSLYN